MAQEEFIPQIARGLFDVATERNTVAAYREDLKFLDWIFKHNQEIVDFLNSPFNSYKSKCKAMENLVGDLMIPGMMTFLKVLIHDSLIPYFSLIREEYNKLANDDACIAEGIVYTPYELDSNTIIRLEREFRRKLDKNIVLKQVIDKDIIAGIKVLLDGTLYEYSIQNRLEEVKKNLLKEES